MNNRLNPSFVNADQQYAPSKPISVRIGYQWNTDDKIPNKKLWGFLSKQFTNVLDSIQKASGKRSSKETFYYRVNRMRARHGSEMLARFIELCDATDILAFDISGHNTNVMFELGLAIAAKGAASGRVFIFIEDKGQKLDQIPSDLKGYFITFYKRSNNSFKLNDPQGFIAALRGIVMDDARARGMWGCKINEVEEEPLKTKLKRK